MVKKNNYSIMNKEILKIKQDFIKCIVNYRKCLEDMSYDVPIEVLCLPKDILGPLKRAGIFRVSDIIKTDLTKVKRLGRVRIAYINTKLREFLPV